MKVYICYKFCFLYESYLYKLVLFLDKSYCLNKSTFCVSPTSYVNPTSYESPTVCRNPACRIHTSYVSHASCIHILVIDHTCVILILSKFNILYMSYFLYVATSYACPAYYFEYKSHILGKFYFLYKSHLLLQVFIDFYCTLCILWLLVRQYHVNCVDMYRIRDNWKFIM